MSDQTPQSHGNERAGFDAAPDVELDPAIERELRAMSTWDGEVPKPSLAARALAEHDEEMREARAKRSWTRQGGLMAAAVAIAGLGLSIGFVSTNKPVERMQWSVASRGDAYGRVSGADRDGADEERARVGKMADAPVDAAGSQQQPADQMQGQVRQMKVGEPASRVASTGAEPAAAPTTSAAPVAPPPAAPAGASAEPKPAETGTRGAPGADLATSAAGPGTDAAKKSESSDAKGEAGGKDTAANNSNLTETDGVTNIRRFGLVDGPGGEAAPAAARPTGGLSGMRGELVQPGAADWAAYVGRSMLLGMPWILLGIALVAIAWIRMRR